MAKNKKRSNKTLTDVNLQKQLIELDKFRYSINNKNKLLPFHIEELITYPMWNACINALCDFISNRKVEILGDPDSDFYKIVQRSLNNISLNDNFIAQFIQSLNYGNIFWEIIYTLDEDYLFYEVTDLIPIPYRFINNYQVNVDENFNEYGELISLPISSGVIEQEKLLYYVYKPHGFGIEGMPILNKDLANTITYARETKVNINIHTHRFANPLFVGKAISSKNANTISRGLQRIKDGLISIVIDKEEDIEAITTETESTGLWGTMENYNREITRTLFIGESLYGTGRGGSYNQASVEVTVFENHLNNLIGNIEDLINNHFIRKLYQINVDRNRRNFLENNDVKISIQKYDNKNYINLINLFNSIGFNYSKNKWIPDLIKALLKDEVGFTINKDDKIVIEDTPPQAKTSNIAFNNNKGNN